MILEMGKSKELSKELRKSHFTLGYTNSIKNSLFN